MATEQISFLVCKNTLLSKGVSIYQKRAGTGDQIKLASKGLKDAKELRNVTAIKMDREDIDEAIEQAEKDLHNLSRVETFALFPGYNREIETEYLETSKALIIPCYEGTYFSEFFREWAEKEECLYSEMED